MLVDAFFMLVVAILFYAVVKFLLYDAFKGD